MLLAHLQYLIFTLSISPFPSPLQKVVKNKKVLRKYTVYCTNPVNDGVFDIAGFVRIYTHLL